MRRTLLCLSIPVLGCIAACSPQEKKAAAADSAKPVSAVAPVSAGIPPAVALRIAPKDLLFGKAPQDKLISVRLDAALDSYAAGKIDACERILRALINEFPLEAPPHVALARFLYVQKKFTAAEAELLTAAHLKPAAYIYVDLGTLYAEAFDRLVEAVDYFNKAALLDPRHAGTHYALGQLYYRLDQPEAALGELAKAIELNPRVVAPFIVRARVYVQLKKIEEALHECEEVLRREPGNRFALEIMADIYSATRQDRLALEYYQKATETAPPDSAAWAKLGMFQQSRERWAEADAAYAKSLQLHPDSALVLNNRAALSLVTGADLIRATGWARQAVKLAPGNPFFLDTLGDLQLRQGDVEAARAALESALAIAPDYPSASYHLAQALHVLKQPSPASEQLRAALASKAIFPERTAAEKLLAQLSAKDAPTSP